MVISSEKNLSKSKYFQIFWQGFSKMQRGSWNAGGRLFLSWKAMSELMFDGIYVCIFFFHIRTSSLVFGYSEPKQRATSGKRIYDDPFTNHEANAQRRATQKLWWIWYHKWFYRCKSRWLRKSDVRKVKALANHHHQNKNENKANHFFSVPLIPANEFWNEFIYINLHFVDLGERKQTYFCRFCEFFSSPSCFFSPKWLFLFLRLLLFNICVFLRLWKRFRNEY